MEQNDIDIFYPNSQAAWRQWLQDNHLMKTSVWVVFYNKSSTMPTLTWSESVDEALCFGWIDSKKVAIDSEKSQQFFSKRKPNGTWSKINKAKIEKLIAEGKMTEQGLKCIETAKQNGSWTILDDVEALIIPEDLETAFIGKAEAKNFFVGMSKSVKKMMLQWLVLAKRPETRQKRIEEIVDAAEKKQKPKPF
jgi:uncharacterized protein YdeI (YjbR/CyaY-like superfamily)